MQNHEEEAKEASSIIKLFWPFRQQVPRSTYTRFAVDGNNFMGDSLQNVLPLLWDLHRKKANPSAQELQSITVALNKVVDDYFIRLQPLIKGNDRDNLWVVFDGLKLKYLVWPGAKKHTYYWPFMAEEATQRAPENEKELPGNFFYFLDWIHSAIKNNLESLGIKVLIAPYEADSQIVKMFKEGIIDCAISEDYEFVHFGVPMVLPDFHHDHYLTLNLTLIDPATVEDALLRRWLKEADNQKKLTFSVLSGSKYMSHYRALSFRQTMETVLDSACLSDFFRLATERFKVPRIKNFRGTFQETSSNLLLLYTFQTCYSLINKQQEMLNSHFFDKYFRQNKIPKKDHNKTFTRVFTLIGEIIQPYDSDENYRVGKIKLHNGKKRANTKKVEGDTLEERTQFAYGKHEWISTKMLGYIFASKDQKGKGKGKGRQQ